MEAPGQKGVRGGSLDGAQQSVIRLQETRDAGCFPEENISNCCDISFKWAAGGVRPSGEPECPFPVATAATPLAPAYQPPQPLCTTPRPWFGVGIHTISHLAQSPPPPLAL